MDLSDDEMKKIFREDGYRLSEHFLEKSTPGIAIFALMKTAYESVDSLITSFASRITRENKKTDCKKGCHWCCSQAVFLAPWEGFYLQELILKRFNPERRSQIKTRAYEKHDHTSTLSLKEQLHTRISCPLLEDKVCSVYPNRPMACGIYLSMNVNSCINQYENPENPEIFAELYDFPFIAGRGINEGIARWMEEKGLDTRNETLESSLLRLLEDRNAMDEWIAG